MMKPLDPATLTKETILTLAIENHIVAMAIKSFSIDSKINWDKALIAAIIWLVQINEHLSDIVKDKITLQSPSIMMNLADLSPDEREKLLSELKRE